MPIDQCHYGSYDKYRDLCITEGAKNGQYNNQGGKIVFSFEHGFNPSGAMGICSSAEALKEYSRRVLGSQLGQNIVGNSIISGRNLAAMNELHKQCNTTQTFNSQTGEIQNAPLHGNRCTHQSLVTMKKDYTDNEKVWKALEKKRIDDEARDARIAENDLKNAQKLEELEKQQIAAAKEQTAALEKIGNSGNDTNKFIEQVLTPKVLTSSESPTQSPGPEEGQEQTGKRETPTKKSKKVSKKKSKKHIYIAIGGAVIGIILLLVLFMPSGKAKGKAKGNSNTKNVLKNSK